MSTARVGLPDAAKGTIGVRIDERAGEAPFHVRGLLNGLPEAAPGAVELLFAATAAYLADRSLSRKRTPDGWSREIQLSFPVRSPDAWPSMAFSKLLSVLTNDNWSIAPYKSHRLAPLATGDNTFASHGDSVSLFSGGLDSYGHVVQLHSSGSSPLLVGHWDMRTLKALQQGATDSIDRAARAQGRLKQFHVATTPSLLDAAEPEKTTRSRGALFLSAGIVVASAAGIGRLDVPENGFVALNTPLTASRSGALSTRSTHPYVIALLNEILRDLELDVHLMNPLLYSTKGDVVSLARSAGLPALGATVSCSHPTGDRWRGDGHYTNCGYCYPCLVRRSGMERALGEDPTPYRFDPFADTAVVNSSRRRADLFALVAALGRAPVRRDIYAVGPLPPSVNPDQLHDMRVRSFAEIREMIASHISDPVRERLGY